MSRIFISHSGRDNRQATALRAWLVTQDPPLANEIFLDNDPDMGMMPGERWKSQLISANSRCEAVICLLSKNWESAPECRTEYRTAENMGKQILCARLEHDTGAYTGEWQHCDLFADGLPHKDVEKVAVSGGAPVAFAKRGLHQLREAIRGAGIGVENFVWPPPSQPDRAPYRGWESFEELDAGVFFGRDAENLRALDKLRGMRTTGVDSLFVVLGPSGSGKSSFLRAGLLPRLRRADRRFVLLDIMRPERRALTGDTGLARAIHQARRRVGLSKPPLGDIENACTGDPALVRTLLEECRQAAANRLPESDSTAAPPTLVLPLDQAEELFSSDVGPEAAVFLRLITELAQPDTDNHHLGLIVATTIRTDRYELMQSAPELAALTSEVFDDLKPMPPNQFREVVTGPATRAKAGGQRLSFAPVVVNRLLEEAAEGGDALPLLALTLRRLYDRYGDTGEITLADYEVMGGMRRVVQNVVDEVLSAEPEHRARQLVELRAAFIPWLASIADNDQPVRRVARWSDLPDASRPLIDAFVEKRLLVKDQRGGQVVIEVALESLLRQWDDLAGWLQDQREELKAAGALEQNAAQWEAAQRSPDWLLTGTRLADAEELIAEPGYRDRLQPARGYLAASRQAESRKLAAEEERRQAELHHAEEQRQAAEALAAAETDSRHKAQQHAAVLRKRSRILAIVAVIALVGGLLALTGFLQATAAKQRAEASARQAIALRLVSEASDMLAGTKSGGDIRALQQILAAHSLAGDTAYGGLFDVVIKRLTTRKIIDTASKVERVAFSPDGHRIATADYDHTVRMWDADTGEPVGQPLNGHIGVVSSVAFSPDGRRLATGGGGDTTVRMWDPDTGRPVGPPLTGHTDRVSSVVFSPDGHRLASGGDDKTVRLWDADTGRPVGPPLTGHTDRVSSVVFSPDGHRLASGGDDKTVRLWDADTGRPVGPPLTGHTDGVSSVVFSPDGHRLASGGDDKTVRLWDADTGRPVGPPLTGHTDGVSSVVFSPDGHRLASGGDDKTVRLWDADTGRPVGPPLTGHTDGVSSVVFSPDGHRLASGSDDKTVRIWNIDTGEPFGLTLAGYTGPAGRVALSPGGHRLAAADSTLRFSTENSTLRLLSADVRLWSADTGQPSGLRLAGHTGGVNALAFSPDGRRLASGGNDATVRLWDADTGQPLVTLTGPTGARRADSQQVAPTTAVTSVAFSPDGHRLASGTTEGTVTLWDVDTGEPVGPPLTGHTEVVTSVAFSPDGHRLATGTGVGTVQLWNVDTSQPVGQPRTEHKPSTVSSLAFSPDGHRLASAGYDQTLRLWDADSGQPLGPPLTGHTGWVTGVAFSPDGQRLASASYDKTVQLWSVATGLPLGSPINQNDPVSTVAFSPDGHSLASVSDMRRLWPAVGTPQMVCDKLTTNMTRDQWRDWVSPDIPYIAACDELPLPWDDAQTPPPAEQIELGFSGLKDPAAVALDAAGNIYVADSGNNRVVRLDGSSTTQTQVPLTGLNHPFGMAVDTAGNVYVADTNNNRVLKWSAASATQTELPFTGLNFPIGVAVDTAGSIYVADSKNKRVLKLNPGSATQTELPFTGVEEPTWVAVDASGNVYVTDLKELKDDVVLKLSTGATAPTELPFPRLGVTRGAEAPVVGVPSSVAVDTAGNIYIVDYGYSQVLELPAGWDALTRLPVGRLKEPKAVAVDTAGSLYVVDSGNNRVLKLPLNTR